MSEVRYPGSILELPNPSLINHSPDAVSEVRFDHKIDAFTVTTHQRWAKGEEIYISYGDLSEHELFAQHGIVFSL